MTKQAGLVLFILPLSSRRASMTGRLAWARSSKRRETGCVLLKRPAPQKVGRFFHAFRNSAAQNGRVESRASTCPSGTFVRMLATPT